MEKSRELNHLQHFKDVCSFFPDGEIEKTEMPDFIVHAENKTLGVELTEVFQPGPSHGESLQAQDSLAIRIVEKAKNLYTQSHGQPLHVQILFHPRVKMSKQGISAIAEKVSRLIEGTQGEAGSSVTLRRTRETLDRFPREVALIHIYQHPNGKLNHWRCSSAGSVPEITKEHLQAVIDKKERKLDNYTSCSEVWLLFVADDLRIPSTVDLAQSAVTNHYATRFDRVFLFWHSSRRYVELHLADVTSERRT
jgi:hypothetical protein